MSVYVFFIPGRPYNALEAALYVSLHRIGFAFAVAGFFVLITWGQIGERISSYFTNLRIKSQFTTSGTEEEEYSQAYSTNGISTSYMDIVPSYDLSSDHTPVIATISTEIIKKTTHRLHNRRTNWNDYRIIIEEAINLNISLKSPEELNTALTNFTSILKEAVKKLPHFQINKQEVLIYRMK
jgi:hypothetical protein